VRAAIGATVTRAAIGATVRATVTAAVTAAAVNLVDAAHVLGVPIGPAVMHTGQAVSTTVAGSFGFRHSATPHQGKAAPAARPPGMGTLLGPPLR
ncbi:MAG TPA: hypothetical protein VF714_00155, partial [Jatrophihabitans sp.]